MGAWVWPTDDKRNPIYIHIKLLTEPYNRHLKVHFVNWVIHSLVCQINGWMDVCQWIFADNSSLITMEIMRVNAFVAPIRLNVSSGLLMCVHVQFPDSQQMEREYYFLIKRVTTSFIYIRWDMHLIGCSSIGAHICCAANEIEMQFMISNTFWKGNKLTSADI